MSLSLRERARKGGLATKRRAENDPDFFKRIGAIGGHNGAGKPKPRKKDKPQPTATPPDVAAFDLGRVDLDALVAALEGS